MKKRKIWIITACLCALAAAAGCGSDTGSGTAMTAQEFKTLIENSGSDIEDAYKKAMGNDQLQVTFDVNEIKSGDGYQEAKFFVFSKEGDGSTVSGESVIPEDENVNDEENMEAAKAGEDISSYSSIEDFLNSSDNGENESGGASGDDTGEELVMIGFLQEYDDRDAAEKVYNDKCFSDVINEGKDFEITEDADSGSVYGRDGNTTFEILCYQPDCEDVVAEIMKKMGYEQSQSGGFRFTGN